MRVIQNMYYDVNIFNITVLKLYFLVCLFIRKCFKYLMLLVLILLFFSTEAQNNNPVPDSGAYWTEISQAPFSDCNNYSYTINRDTAIKGVQYNVLWKTGIVAHYNQSFGCGQLKYTYSNYAGAYRSDTSGNRVYFIRPQDSIEVLLYDFSLQAGDTVKNIYRDAISDTDLVIRRVDTIHLNNTIYKKFIIDDCSSSPFPDTIYWIEGIGSNRGFLPDYRCFNFGGITALECFNRGNTVIYNYNASSCNLITSIAKSKQDRFFKIYPNPAYGLVNMESKETIERVEIYNMQGQLVSSLDFERSRETQRMMQVQLPEEKGLYLVQIKTEDGQLYTEKVIRK